VKDASDNIIPGAKVEIEMQEHAFGFGTAFVGCRIPGNRCYNQEYVDKILDLDGKGHRFNVGVMENALKWDGWEEQWIGTPDQTMDAVEFLSNAGIQMRGHTLFWPGYVNMPDDIASNSSDLNYLRARIDSRIHEMIDNERLGPLLREWDVLNEITQNTDLAQAFSSDPNFGSGREIYQEIIQKVRAIDPDVKLYINDYVTLSGGGSGAEVVNRYKSYLDEIHETVGMDGIGFQAHIGSPPTSILKAEETLNEFFARYGTRMSVTEYDINPNISEEVQARYLGDFLTLVFSYPAMDAFIMWGFWDGNHWKDNAPLYDVDWNLKPSGEVFFEKVFDEWWTDEEAVTDENGLASFRPFKGTHRIIVTKDGEVDSFTAVIEDDRDIEYVFGTSTSTVDLWQNEIQIVPNQLSPQGSFVIEGINIEQRNISLSIYDIQGRVNNIFRDIQGNATFEAPAVPGVYFVQINTDQGLIVKKLVVR
jgi:GH35 family endo-1,4-beta-xylanase